MQRAISIAAITLTRMRIHAAVRSCITDVSWEAPLKSIEVFDLDAERWTLLETEIPEHRHAAAAALYKNKLCYVGGGPTAEMRLDLRVVQYYDIDTGEWAQLPGRMSTARQQCTANVHGHLMYVAGGVDDDAPLSTMDVYNFITEVRVRYGNELVRIVRRRSHTIISSHPPLSFTVYLC